MGFNSPTALREPLKKRMIESPSPNKSRLGRHNHLFEEFFIIGIDTNNISKLNWNKNESVWVNP